jgi:hypothetical protein
MKTFITTLAILLFAGVAHAQVTVDVSDFGACEANPVAYDPNCDSSQAFQDALTAVNGGGTVRCDKNRQLFVGDVLYSSPRTRIDCHATLRKPPGALDIMEIGVVGGDGFMKIYIKALEGQWLKFGSCLRVTGGSSGDIFIGSVRKCSVGITLDPTVAPIEANLFHGGRLTANGLNIDQSACFFTKLCKGNRFDFNRLD